MSGGVERRDPSAPPPEWSPWSARYCLQVLLDAGVRAVVQPGGSIRDEEVIAAAQAAGVTMYLTGSRHFSH